MRKSRSTPSKARRASLWSAASRPFRALWNKNEAFHVRLMSYVGIATLVTAVVFGVPTLARDKPVVVVMESAPQPALTEQAAPSCEAEAPDTFRTCLDGRYLDDRFEGAVHVPPASVFEVQAKFQNTSDETQQDVVLRLELPDDVTYVEGTTWLHNANGTREVADGITRGGIIIGGYLPGGDAYLKLALRSGHTSGYECGQTIAVVKLVTITDLGKRATELPVTVRRVC